MAVINKTIRYKEKILRYKKFSNVAIKIRVTTWWLLILPVYSYYETVEIKSL